MGQKAHWMRRLRERLDYTQAEMAEAVGITQQHVCAIEKRRKGLSKWRLLEMLDQYKQELRDERITLEEMMG